MSPPTAPNANPQRNATAARMFYVFPLDELVRQNPQYHYRASSSITINNPVLPVMARSQWSNVDYDALLPGLQMCAKLMLSSPSLQYHSAHCLTDPQKVEYTDQEGSYHAVFRKATPLTDTEKAQIEDVFAKLAPYIHFTHADLGPDIAGCCRPVANEPVPQGIFPGSTAGRGSTIVINTAYYEGILAAIKRFEPVPQGIFPGSTAGRGSTIVINTAYYEGILAAIKRFKEDPTSTEKQDLMFAGFFGLAKLLGHEFAHAVAFARWPKGVCMPFEKQGFSEDGYDWESSVFGGIVDVDETFCLWREWPSPPIVEAHLRSCYTDLGVTASLETLTSADHEISWRIPPCYIRALFQNGLHDHVLPMLGDAAWRFPKLIGLRRAPVKLGKMSKCYCESCFLTKEFVMRLNARGNGSLEKTGFYEKALFRKEHKRKKAELKNPGEGVSLEQLAELPLEHVVIPTPPEKRNCGFDPHLSTCIRGGWSIWFRPQGSDTRTVHSFGVPDGFGSLRDGTVVADTVIDTVVAHAQQRADIIYELSMADWDDRTFELDLELSMADLAMS